MTRAQTATLHSLEQMALLAERALASSVADETEIVWLETLRGRAGGGDRATAARRVAERVVLIRVLDRGRVGSHRTTGVEAGELEEAIRQAIAQSRVREPLPGLPHLPADESELEIPGGSPDGLVDPALQALDPQAAERLAAAAVSGRERLELEWADARVVVFNSRGVRRSAAVTAAQATVRCGECPGAGSAAAAARSLERLDLAALAERARGRHASGGRAAQATGTGGLPLLLAPEAVAALVELLNREALTAQSYHDGLSFLREHLGVQVFDRALTLRDDGTDPSGLPFPFDLEGTAKRPLDLVARGAPRTPALDQRQAAVLGLPPTGHAVGGADARAEHLFLEAGEASDDELLAATDGGLWIGALDPVECSEPRRLRFRARARSVRRVASGRLGEPVADFVWQDSLLRALSTLAGVGRVARTLPSDAFPLGATSTPALALAPPPA